MAALSTMAYMRRLVLCAYTSQVLQTSSPGTSSTQPAARVLDHLTAWPNGAKAQDPVERMMQCGRVAPALKPLRIVLSQHVCIHASPQSTDLGGKVRCDHVKVETLLVIADRLVQHSKQMVGIWQVWLLAYDLHQLGDGLNWAPGEQVWGVRCNIMLCAVKESAASDTTPTSTAESWQIKAANKKNNGWTWDSLIVNI